MRARGPGRKLDLKLYLELTRGISVSFAYLLPLLAAYEVGIWLIGSDLRNSAEVSLKRWSGIFGPSVVWAQRAVLVATAVITWRLARRNVPALRLYPVFVLEASCYALLFGPLVSFLTRGLGLGPAAAGPLVERVLLSIGAGVYEELVFRFLVFAGGFALLHRACRLPRKSSFVSALLSSALLFSAYHHAGPQGEEFRLMTFAFRAAAGVLLGLVFAGRGLALAAYLHAFYDILRDLDEAGGAIG